MSLSLPDILVDLSHWQVAPNFAAMKAAGVAAVILKATQGVTMVDPTFPVRSMAAARAGLLVGAYHFCDASPPVRQVEHFLSVAGHLLVLSIDIEPNGIGDTVTVAQAAEIAARLHQATGRLPLVYIGRWGPAGNGAGLPNKVLARCPLWLAEYGTDPVCPAGWDDAWTFWQYTDAGVVPGVAEPCDCSRFTRTPQELSAWWDV